MRVQQSRTDVLPLTWEIPTAIVAGWALLAALALPAAQGAATWLTGDSFAWPNGHLLESLWGLLHGETGRGLTAIESAALPPAAWIYTAVMVAELLISAVAIWALTAWSRILGPRAQHGMARRHQLRAVLGVGHLRRRRTIIRPDLYGVPHDSAADRTEKS